MNSISLWFCLDLLVALTTAVPALSPGTQWREEQSKHLDWQQCAWNCHFGGLFCLCSALSVAIQPAYANACTCAYTEARKSVCTAIPPCFVGLSACTSIPPCFVGLSVCTSIPPCFVGLSVCASMPTIHWSVCVCIHATFHWSVCASMPIFHWSLLFGKPTHTWWTASPFGFVWIC